MPGGNVIVQETDAGGTRPRVDGGPQPNATLMQQLDRLVGSMTDTGYTFVTLSELLAASR